MSTTRTRTKQRGATKCPTVNLNLNVRGLSPSAMLAINERSAALREEGPEVFRLGLGQSPFPVPRVVVEELRGNAHQKDYLPVRGLAALREAVAAYHSRKHGIERTGDNVLVGPGSKELMFLIQLVYYGDLVIPTPSWVTYAPQAQIIGRHVRWLNTQRDKNWELQPEELEQLCRDDPDRPRLVILNYPNNPTGYAYSVNTLRALADVARRYRVVMLSDEIYGEIHHQGRHNSMAEFYPEGTIISSGLSKWCGAGGWRLGTFTFPDSLSWLQQSVAVVASESFTSTSTPIQYAAVRAFEGGEEIENYLFQCRRVLRALGGWCFDRLKKTGIELTAPHGAFYLFPDFEPALRKAGINTSTELCEKLLEATGVATLPGAAFGRRPAELTLRLAYVDFDGIAALISATGTAPDEDLGESFVLEHCRPVTQAVDRICDWVSTL